jgi:hypothetical protein
MPTFISYSLKDEAVYSTLCLAFDAKGVTRWDRQSMSPGDSLATQLQNAISACHACVFLATRRAIESSWCAAELGAFWGAGKRVYLFMADPDLAESTLPPQFKGTLRVDNASALIEAIKKSEDAYATQGLENPTFFASASDYGKEKDWDALLLGTNNHFDLLGLTLNYWLTTNKFREKILEKARGGCEIRLLLMHENNPALVSLFPQNNSLESVRRTINENHSILKQLQATAENQNISVRQLAVSPGLNLP